MVRERTFVMIKPDAVQRGLIGEIIKRIENAGLKIVAMKFIVPTLEQAQKHYEVHKDKDFYEGLVKFITSSPSVPMIVEGKDAVARVRQLMGKTKPLDAEVGSIRGDLVMDIGRNLIHGADSLENAKKEMSIYFDENEIVEWDWVLEKWIYE